MPRAWDPTCFVLSLCALACAPFAEGDEIRTGDRVAESAIEASNGRLLNGRSYNGRTWNGRTYNGRTWNGRTYNGRGWNGRGYNGRTYNGRTYNGANLTLNGSLLVLTEDGVPLADLGGGIETAVEFDDGSTLPIRIEGPRAADDGNNSDVFLYEILFWDGAGWVPMDSDDAGNPVGAIPLAGLWDMREGVPPDPMTGEGGGGSWIDAPAEITFAVRGYALAKCVEIGYKPWVVRREQADALVASSFLEPVTRDSAGNAYVGASGRYEHSTEWTLRFGANMYQNAATGRFYTDASISFADKPSRFFERDHQEVTLRQHHQACTRMIRADYCGDGRSHTNDGTLIDVWDGFGLQGRSAWPLESSWKAGGASCVNHVRWESIDSVSGGSATVGEYIEQNCPSVRSGSDQACSSDPGFTASTAHSGYGCYVESSWLYCDPTSWSALSRRPVVMNGSETLVGRAVGGTVSFSTVFTYPGITRDLIVTAHATNDVGNPAVGADVTIELRRDGAPISEHSGATGTDGRVSFQLASPPAGLYEARIVSISDPWGLIWDRNEASGALQFVQPTSLRVPTLTLGKWQLGSSTYLAVGIDVATNLGSSVQNATVTFDVLRNGAVYKSNVGGTATGVTLVSNKRTGTFRVVMRSVRIGGLTWDGITPPNSFTW